MARDEVAVARNDPEEETQEEEEEELVDPIDVLKTSCSATKECQELNEKYMECNNRVNSRSKTEETCTEELIDYLHCVDHCLKDSILGKLK